MDERMEATELLGTASGPVPEAVHAPESAPLSPAAGPAEQKKNTPQKPRKSAEERKRRRRIIRIVIILLIIAAGIVFVLRHFSGGNQEDDTMILTDIVQYGAITAKVEGSGITRAKNSETILTAAAGIVQEIMVEEGDTVAAGDVLFVIDSESARQALSDAEEGVRTAQDAVSRAEEGVRTAEEGVRTAEESVRTAEESVRTAQENVRTEEEGVRTEQENVTRAQENVKTEREGVDSALKRLETAREDLEDARKKREDLTLEADWAGKLTSVQTLHTGDKLTEGTVVATLVDDNTMRLTQWYSAGFVGDIREGQPARVSVPSLMSTVDGTVERVHNNLKINPEDGANYFSVDILIPNTGALAADMAASAVIFTDSDNAGSPDMGKLEYSRTKELKAGATGDILQNFLEDYLPVEAGELLLILDGEEVEKAIDDAQKVVEDREKDVDSARERVTDAQNSVTDAEKRVESQRRRVTDAQKGVETAKKGVETAQKGVESAKRGVTDAERNVESAQKAVTDAQKKVQDAQKVLDECRAVSPIDGRVVGLDLTVGEEASASKAAMTISDPTVISVNATVDERNMSYVRKGMDVELTQFDTTAFGTVDSVSLSSTLNNGVATYPMTILADNSDETLQINSNIQYSLVASQNDNCLIVPVQCVHNVANEKGDSISVVYVAGEIPPENALENIMDTEMIPEGFWPVEVETGIQDSYHVEIRSGVEEGMEVFTQMQMSYGFGLFG